MTACAAGVCFALGCLNEVLVNHWEWRLSLCTVRRAVTQNVLRHLGEGLGCCHVTMGDDAQGRRRVYSEGKSVLICECLGD